MLNGLHRIAGLVCRMRALRAGGSSRSTDFSVSRYSTPLLLLSLLLLLMLRLLSLTLSYAVA